MRAFAELSADGKRIEVHFKYDPNAVAAIKTVPGRRPVYEGNKFKFWTIPADMTAARRLREEFGEGLELGEAVRAWGREAQRAARQIGAVSNADDAELENVAPSAAEWLRPYQRADVKMMALTNVGNFNQPGVGKTVEVIYAVEEAKLKGPHIVVCPTSLFKDPWRDELEVHAPGARVFWGATPDERRRAIADAHALWTLGEADNVWLLINPEFARCKKLEADEQPGEGVQILSKDHKGRSYVAADPISQMLFEMTTGALVADEFHKFGLGEDRNTLFARGLAALRKNCSRAYALSGTPIGGKSVRMWGILNFIEPSLYPAKWRWIENWLVDTEGRKIKAGEGQKPDKIEPGREEEFYAAHGKHIVRRNRADALPGLPPKQIIDVWTEMTPKQRKAYDAFVRAGEVAADGGRISANGILSEFARLKQLANAHCEVVDGDVYPTTDSGKLPVLLDRLDTYGVRAKDWEPGARAIVASESQRFVRVVLDYLRKNGIEAMPLDGKVTGAERDSVIAWYKNDNKRARVLVMTTQTGGVGLNLGMTGSIHILDETWNPDDQEQLEDRGMRNRTTPLMVLYYRTRGTIQEYINEVAAGKQINNKNVVDIRKAINERKGR